MPNGAATGSVTVVIPAYNEAEGVVGVLREVREVLERAGIWYEIVVVDDGSADATAERAVQEGARVLSHFSNRGYGAALKTGIRAARYERIAIIDADGTYPAEAIPTLLEALDHADMVVGARGGCHAKFPLSKRLAKWGLGTLANYLSRTRIPDLNSGLRAFRRACVLQYLGLLPNKFSFTTTITLSLLCDDYTVRYVPIDYHPRVGRSKIVPWDAVNFLSLIFRTIMIFNPLRVFGPLAFLAGTYAVLKGGVDLFVFHDGHLSASAVSMLVASIQLLLAGMLAEAISRRIGQQNMHQYQAFLERGVQETALATEETAGTPGVEPSLSRGD